MFNNKLLKKIVLIAVLITLLFSIVACSSHNRFTPPPPVPYDMNNVPKPESREQWNDFDDFITQQFTVQGEQCFDVPRQVRALTNNRAEAMNVDAFDNVPDCSWFTNRNGLNPMTNEEIIKGPNTGNGPDTENTWTIIRAKSEGVTAGFAIVDSRGDKYFIKFDPIDYPALNSGAEVIGTKLFYASGYFTPENYITHFNPEILKLGDNVKILDNKGRKRLMNEDDLKNILKTVKISEDGTIRATASRYIPGELIGPFRYSGTVKEDYNDVIPHERRREIRALYVIGGWLNHIDAKGANSLDSYMRTDKGGYVRHFMMDFGTTMGSGGRGPHPSYRGYENEFDPFRTAMRIFSFGLYVSEWDKESEVKYKSVGRFHSDTFKSHKFKPIFPNPAYEEMTKLDAYWGAKIVTSFTDEQIKAAVSAAELPEPGASEYMARILCERRDIVGNYWFNHINTVDNFNLINKGSNYILDTDDIAVTRGYKDKNSVKYEVEFLVDHKEISSSVFDYISIKNIVIDKNAVSVMNNDSQLAVSIKTIEGCKNKKPVIAYIEKAQDGSLELIGIERKY